MQGPNGKVNQIHIEKQHSTHNVWILIILLIGKNDVMFVFLGDESLNAWYIC